MRRGRFARAGFVVLFGVALGTQSCSDPPGQLFGEKGGAGGVKAGSGGAASGSGGASTGGKSDAGGAEPEPSGGDGGADMGEGRGGAFVNGGTAPIAGGRVGVGGTGVGGRSGTGGSGVGGNGAGAGGSPVQAGSGGSSAGAPNGGKGSTGNVPNEIVQQITRNTDDCTWILVNGAYQERLRFSAADPWLEVGSDDEQGRIGLRFVLPVPPKANIVAASLQMQRVDGNAAASNTLTIQVFDSGNVPSFDSSHDHGPGKHVSAGFFSTAVRGSMVGERGKLVTSADLRVLVQRVVDRADFVEGTGTIGFVISPDSIREWAAYGDSSESMGATLRVSYRVP